MNTNKLLKTDLGDNLLYRDEVYAIIGAAMEVHNQLGCGFLEAIYQEALELELANKQIPFEASKHLSLEYKGVELKKGYIADIVAYSKIILELKAIEKLTSTEDAQLLNYLKATGFKLGLLINFGSTKLEWKRRILTKNFVKV
jgi:GxxExxY protein